MAAALGLPLENDAPLAATSTEARVDGGLASLITPREPPAAVEAAGTDAPAGGSGTKVKRRRLNAAGDSSAASASAASAMAAAAAAAGVEGFTPRKTRALLAAGNTRVTGSPSKLGGPDLAPFLLPAASDNDADGGCRAREWLRARGRRAHSSNQWPAFPPLCWQLTT
jgi:hypothetical protein